MSFALLVCVALLLTVAYFVVLLSGEAIAWLLSRVNHIVHERRVRTTESHAHSTYIPSLR